MLPRARVHKNVLKLCTALQQQKNNPHQTRHSRRLQVKHTYTCFPPPSSNMASKLRFCAAWLRSKLPSLQDSQKPKNAQNRACLHSKLQVFNHEQNVIRSRCAISTSSCVLETDYIGPHNSPALGTPCRPLHSWSSRPHRCCCRIILCVALLLSHVHITHQHVLYTHTPHRFVQKHEKTPKMGSPAPRPKKHRFQRLGVNFIRLHI